MPSLWAASLFWSGDTVITPPPGPSTPGYAGWQAGPLLAWTLLLSLLPGALPVGLLLLPEVVPYRRRGLARWLKWLRQQPSLRRLRRRHE